MSKPRAGAAVVKEFKYRSIDDIVKRKIIEDQRANLEAEHYALTLRIDALEGLSDDVKSGREQEMTAMKDQRAIVESLVDEYNDKLLDLDAEESKEETD